MFYCLPLNMNYIVNLKKMNKTLKNYTSRLYFLI